MNIKANKYHNQDPAYYKYREFVVGLFTFIPMIMIPIIFITMLLRSDFTKEKFDLYFTHTLNAQIAAGDDVFILSKKVGYVRTVELNPQGYVVVKIAVEEEYRPIIRDDTRIRLKQKNVIMGDWQMEMVLGNSAAQMVEHGDTLDIVPPVDMAKLSSDMIGVAGLVNDILDTVANGNGIISRLLNTDTLINRRVGETSAQIRSALTSLNEVLEESNHLITSSNHLMDSVVSIRTPQVFDEVDAVLLHSDSMVSTIDQFFIDADSIPDDIRRALEGLNRDIYETEILLRAAQKHWLLRSEVEEVLEEDEDTN